MCIRKRSRERRAGCKQLQAGKALITWPTGKSIKVHNEAAAEMWLVVCGTLRADLMRISVFFYGCFLSWLLPPIPFTFPLPIGWQNLIITDGCVALHVAEMCAAHTHRHLHRRVARSLPHAHPLDACQTRLGNLKKHISLECTPLHSLSPGKSVALKKSTTATAFNYAACGKLAKLQLQVASADANYDGNSFHAQVKPASTVCGKE